MIKEQIKMIRHKLNNIDEEIMNRNKKRIHEIEFEIGLLEDEIKSLREELEELENEGTEEVKTELERQLLNLELLDGEICEILDKTSNPILKNIKLASLFTTIFKDESRKYLNMVYVSESFILGCNGYFAIKITDKIPIEMQYTAHRLRYDRTKQDFTIETEKIKEEELNDWQTIPNVMIDSLKTTTDKITIRKSELLNILKQIDDKNLVLELPNRKIAFNNAYMKTSLLALKEDSDIEISYSDSVNPVYLDQKDVSVFILPVRRVDLQ